MKSNYKFSRKRTQVNLKREWYKNTREKVKRKLKMQNDGLPKTIL